MFAVPQNLEILKTSFEVLDLLRCFCFKICEVLVEETIGVCSYIYLCVILDYDLERIRIDDTKYNQQNLSCYKTIEIQQATQVIKMSPAFTIH